MCLNPVTPKGLFPRMYLLYGDHLKNELHGYTVNEFTALVDQINALPRGSVKKKKLSRLIIGQSIKLDVDKDGRTVMPINQPPKMGGNDWEGLDGVGTLANFGGASAGTAGLWAGACVPAFATASSSTAASAAGDCSTMVLRGWECPRR